MTRINGYAAPGPGQPFESFQHELGELRGEDVEIKVHSCGLCHSDLSMWHNDWGITTYPFVPGHEIVGTIVQVGDQVKGLKQGDKVGVGWFVGSCMSCNQCMSGDQHLCGQTAATIVGRHGGFSERVRCHWAWATPLPEALDLSKAGPLFCGGITVFGPMVAFDVKPTDRVGVIGIGGLGHLALQFLNKWGCEVTAFTSSKDKADAARAMGAHHIVDSRAPDELHAIRGTLDFILNTTNVTLDWSGYLGALAPHGRFHSVGAVAEPMKIGVFELMGGQKSISSSPLSSPGITRKMIDFCARHDIYPVTEHFPLDQINEAFDHLASGKARYRVVLDMP